MAKVEEAAEKAVLGACLVNENTIPEIVTRLKPDDFYDPVHQNIFALISEKFTTGEAVEPVTLAAELRERTGHDDPAVFFRLMDSVLTTVNVDYHISLVLEASTRRKLGSLGTRVAQLADSAAETDLIVQEITDGLANATTVGESETVAVGDVVDAVMTEVEARQQGTSKQGLMTGFTELDELTNGLKGGQMVIVAARPGLGKSTLAVDFMRHASIKNNIPTLIFSLEMGKDELVERIISAESSVYTQNLKRGSMSQDDWAAAGEAAQRLDKAPLYIADSPELTMVDIAARARLMQAQHGIKMIVVDYLQLLTSGKKSESRQQEVSDFSRQLKLLAKSLDVPIIAIAQLNRGVEMRGEDALPKASDLRESGSLEQDADIILLIHRPDAQNRDHARAGEADIIVAKHRGGSTGTIPLAHELHMSRFRNPISF
ncbi:replicative DNA helicase [Corynebacterium urealyticum]|uniref:replicative DNA helicase n=1 Tax=Corynebacterium urealyticum TaxID=43771 RepID=UPI00293E5F9F|nr:replicative DNA helicase [Corynebacterium urealyticum]WOH94949.1 replicative DNA helicase [Corynebacterium urealyticum]